MHKRRRVASGNVCTTEEDATEEPATDLDKLIHQHGNQVYFHAPVSRESILALVRCLCDAENAIYSSKIVTRDRHIQLFIHSEGGDAYAGLSGMNHIQKFKTPIHTISDGFVASAATFLLLGGAKRYAMPHSTILIHQLTTCFWGKYAELIDEMENSHQLMRTIRAIYKKNTTITKKRLNSLLKKELTITAEECVEYGIVMGYHD